MTINERLNMVEELLDIGQDTLDMNTELEQVSEWDSMASIALIAMFDDCFGKLITPEEVRNFKTVKDIVDRMD